MIYTHFGFNVPSSTKDYINSLLPLTTNIKLATKILVLGGDGTLIHILSQIENSPTIFAINYGKCGALMIFPKEDLTEIIQKIMQNYTFPILLRKRYKANNIAFINEVLITTKLLGRLNEFKIFINDVNFKTVFCDSVIVSTPSGSSAYNLSANGPYLTEDCEVFIINLVSPFRNMPNSIVIGNKNRIRIEGGTLCILDGHVNVKCDDVNVSYDGDCISFATLGTKDSVEKQKLDKIFK